MVERLPAFQPLPKYVTVAEVCIGLGWLHDRHVAATRDRRELRFTTSGDSETERAWRTHWVSAELSAPRPSRVCG